MLQQHLAARRLGRSNAAPGFRRGFFLVVCGLGGALAQAQPAVLPAPAADNRFQALPGISAEGTVLARGALRGPAHWRVLVVPGSGCASLGPSADRLARSLGHAEVLLLQKPDLVAPGMPCSTLHLQGDNLATWQTTALQQARQALAVTTPGLPLVLVGLSEGTELLPGLASALPGAALLVLVGHAGLDPADAGALQADRLEQRPAWQAVMDATRLPANDNTLLQGRHPRYWQVLQTWPLLAPLLADPRPLLQARGGHDAQMPLAAYQRFADVSRQRTAPTCLLRFPQADHELREPGTDRLQTLWRWLDATAAAGAQTGEATIWLARCAAWQAEAELP